MSFRSPELLWLALLAPIVGLAALVLWRRRLAATAAWASRGLWSRLGVHHRRWRIRLQIAALTVAVLGVALALARPVREASGGPARGEIRSDLILVLDTSLSMRAEDVRPSRLEVARILARRLLEAPAVDRVGLVQTEGGAAVLSPLTADRDAVVLLLDSLQAGSTAIPGTDLATGIRQATALATAGRTGGDIVVLTDGETHTGEAAAAAATAADRDLAVHVVGVGTAAGAPIPLAAGGYKTTAAGRRVVTRLDSDRIETIAGAGRGHAIVTPGPGADLVALTAELGARGNQMREISGDVAERFQSSLVVAVSALLLVLGISPFETP